MRLNSGLEVSFLIGFALLQTQHLLQPIGHSFKSTREQHATIHLNLQFNTKSKHGIHEIINFPGIYSNKKNTLIHALYVRRLYRPVYTRTQLLLIGETKVNTERREDKTLELVLGLELVAVLLDSSEILGVQLDQVGAVGLDAGWGDGLGQDGGTTGDCNSVSF